MSYSVEKAEIEIAACPTDLPGTARARAGRGNREARSLARDIREHDKRMIWGRLRLMERDQLEALCVSLAAGWEPHRNDQFDWCESFGGVAALHPDYEGRPRKQPSAEQETREATIVALYEAGLGRTEIAMRVGCSYSLVQKTIAAVAKRQEQRAAA